MFWLFLWEMKGFKLSMHRKTFVAWKVDAFCFHYFTGNGKPESHRSLNCMNLSRENCLILSKKFSNVGALPKFTEKLKGLLSLPLAFQLCSDL